MVAPTRSWSRPSRSAWGSTRRTSGLCTTTTCPRRWRTTPRKSAGPAATGWTRAAKCSRRSRTESCWRISRTAIRRPPSPSPPCSTTCSPSAKRSTCGVNLSAYDIRPLVLETILTYLELTGYVGDRHFYTEYKFQPLRSSKEILAKFDQPRADFLRILFKASVPLKIWYFLDVARYRRKLRAEPDRRRPELPGGTGRLQAPGHRLADGLSVAHRPSASRYCKR